MTFYRIILRLARNPGHEHAEADDHRGYTLTAPLTEDGHLDAQTYSTNPERCSVRHFAPDIEPQMGRLARHGRGWAFDYGDIGADDEKLFRLGEHRFDVGDYVSVVEKSGEQLTYKVTERTRVDA